MTTPLERRKHIRYPVEDEATLLLVSDGSSLPCRLLELSHEGCRVRTQRDFRAGTRMRVEMGFRLNGVAFRLGGVTEWTNGRNTVGVRFLDMTDRRRAALAEILAELETKRAPAAGKEAAASEEPPPVAAHAGPFPTAAAPPRRYANQERENRADPRGQSQPRQSQPGQSQLGQLQLGQLQPGQDRRAQARHPVDCSAILLFVDVGARITGRVLDLSPAGCRIRTAEKLAVGIYRRVELEFQLRGMPLRLAGVTQAIHDKFTVGIRFVDLSERKREQLSTLIAELEEKRASQLRAG